MKQHARTSFQGGAGLKARLAEELGKYAIVSAYLFVCFGALLLYKAALLQQEGVQFAPLAVALGKAMIVGKFLLIGETLRVGRRLAARHLLGRIAQRVLLLLLLLIVLTAAEELVVGLIRGHAIADIWAEMGSKPLAEVLTEMLLMLLILVPLVAVTELNRALGRGTLRRLLTSGQASGRAHAGTQPDADGDRG